MPLARFGITDGVILLQDGLEFATLLTTAKQVVETVNLNVVADTKALFSLLMLWYHAFLEEINKP